MNGPIFEVMKRIVELRWSGWNCVSKVQVYGSIEGNGVQHEVDEFAVDGSNALTSGYYMDFPQ